ncbi:FHA domain-containing protein [Mucilaginibacter antarcticus]|uniref:FHA domain-containing protein n=1 Tax=Mucilaginibacter antarcticus TaxID=1855725 RepID=A0ABW5XJE7_9SPHI
MFKLFSRDNDGPTDVKEIRDTLLRGIKDNLQKSEGGEGNNIKGINLFIAADGNDKHTYQSAVYQDEPERFKDEVQRIADDYDIGLPSDWKLEVCFDEQFPADSIKLEGVQAALFIRTKDHILRKSGSAYIRILNGEAEKPVYSIKSEDGRINIGREKKAQVTGGFFRTNQIAFPGDIGNEPNKYISRQHAHVAWNNDKGCFMIFADEGGIPPGNKVKIRPLNADTLIKLHSSEIGHELSEGDQIILGETAVIEFSYKKGK